MIHHNSRMQGYAITLLLGAWLSYSTVAHAELEPTVKMGQRIDIDMSYAPEGVQPGQAPTEEQQQAHQQRIHQQIVAHGRQQQEIQRQQAEQQRQTLTAAVTRTGEPNQAREQHTQIEQPQVAVQAPVEIAEKPKAKSPWFMLLVFAVLGAAIYWWWNNSRQPAPVRTTRQARQRGKTTGGTFTGQSQQHTRQDNSAYQEQHQQAHGQQTQEQQNDDFAQAEQNSAPITSDRVQAYLDDFFSEQPDNPMAYRAELKALNLDFSAASLQRLDHFLLQLKQQTQPDYTGYLEQRLLQQFVIFCGIYLATTIARVTHQSIKWYSFEEARQRLGNPNFPQTLGTLLSCTLGNEYHHLPIETICDVLFTPVAENTCSERLAFYQQHAKPLIPLLPDSRNAAVTPTDAIQELWVKAMNMAGFLAHYSLYMVEGGSSLTPTLLQEEAGEVNFVSLMGSDPDTGLQRLRDNPKNLSYQPFAHDIFANLPTGRMDAISIHVRCYHEAKAEWILTIPYRPASHPQGFAFFIPILAYSSTPDSLNPLLFKAFYAGIDSFNSPGNTWQRFFNELSLV